MLTRAPSPQTSTRPTSPRPLTLARALLVLVALSHLIVPIVMATRRSELQAEIQRRQPDLDSASVRAAATTAVNAATVFHALLLILTIVLIMKLPTGRHWVLRLTIISQLASVGFSAVSWTQSSMFHPVLPIIDAVQIMIVVCTILIWKRSTLTAAPRSTGS